MKKRPGRPSLGATIPLTIHITPSQYKKLIALAARAGRPLTAVMRGIIEKTPWKAA